VGKANASAIGAVACSRYLGDAHWLSFWRFLLIALAVIILLVLGLTDGGCSVSARV
jgi:hypothetical protein